MLELIPGADEGYLTGVSIILDVLDLSMVLLGVRWNNTHNKYRNFSFEGKGRGSSQNLISLFDCGTIRDAKIL